MLTKIKNKQIYGYIAAITAVIFLGFHSVLIRYLSEQSVSTEFIAAVRLFIGAFALTGISLAWRGVSKKKREKANFKYDKFFWLTVIGLSFNFILFHVGLQYTFASNAMLIETFSPVFVLFIVIFLFPDRLPFLKTNNSLVTRLLFIVVAGSVGSSLLLINQPEDPTLNFDLKYLGDFLEFGAMLFFALFFIGSSEYKKRNMDTSSVQVTAHFLFFAGLIVSLMLPFTITLEDVMSITPMQWLWIFILGFFSTGMSYALWHKASMYLKVVSLTLLFNLTAVFTVVLESIVFGTTITWQLVLSAVLIILASVFAELTYKEGSEESVKNSEIAEMNDTLT